MKTPEEIADDFLSGDAYSADMTYPDMIAAAIEADRAQRAALLEREANILDGYRRELPDGTRHALTHNMGRASEAMRLAAGWDATRAFQESHR